MKVRFSLRTGAFSRLVSREDILKTPNLTTLSELAKQHANVSVSDRCDAMVNGGPFSAPLWSFDASDIELIEVYVNDAGPGGPRRAGGKAFEDRGPSRNPARFGPVTFGGTDVDSSCANSTVFVWLRQ
jgi:hypothetical protein